MHPSASPLIIFLAVIIAISAEAAELDCPLDMPEANINCLRLKFTTEKAAFDRGKRATPPKWDPRAAAAALEADRKACPSFPQPEIGMIKEQVLRSKWGRPIKVNTTETANHVYEQWVYEAHTCMRVDKPNFYPLD